MGGLGEQGPGRGWGGGGTKPSGTWMQTTEHEAFIYLPKRLPANTGSWEGWSSERPGLHDAIKNTEPCFAEQNGPQVPRDPPLSVAPGRQERQAA